MKIRILSIHTMLLLALLAACAAPAGGGAQSVAKSDKSRNTSPAAGPADLQKLTGGTRAFAFDLYQQLRAQPGNLFFSPHSISVALAMTYAGARGATAQEMRQALHYALPDASLHPAFNALQLELAKREKNQNDPKLINFRLSVVNALWGQTGYKFVPDYLDVLGIHYGAGMRLLDYRADPEAARQVINDWVANQTADKIKDLIPAGAIDDHTILVLANAIYFNAPWLTPFEASVTQPGPFTLQDGSQQNVPMMNISKQFPYASGSGFSAVELPYAGGEVSMVLLVPDAGQFYSFEQGLTPTQWDSIRQNLKSTQVNLSLPKFQFTSEFNLNAPLGKLGMVSAFQAGQADLSGMDGTRALFLSQALHKAFIKLDEKGTEAAAATAVVVGLTSMPANPVTFKIDRPFLFLIQDKPTGEILFLGRVLNPAQ
jgi:serpin B